MASFKQELEQKYNALNPPDISDLVQVNLPSLGKLYVPSHPLASGKIWLRYPTTKDEDVLYDPRRIQAGTSIDDFMRSIIVGAGMDSPVPFKYNELLVCDKNYAMVQGRILLYGHEYRAQVQGSDSIKQEEITADLRTLPVRELDIENVVQLPGREDFGFEFQLETGEQIFYRVLTVGDEHTLQKSPSADKLTKKLATCVVEFAGETDPAKILARIEKMRSTSSKKLREDIATKFPDVVMESTVVLPSTGIEEKVRIPWSREFFWPSINSREME